MTRIEEFRQAAKRPNTRRSYVSAVRHFEDEWRGLLPDTIETIARYMQPTCAEHNFANSKIPQRPLDTKQALTQNPCTYGCSEWPWRATPRAMPVPNST